MNVDNFEWLSLFVCVNRFLLFFIWETFEHIFNKVTSRCILDIISDMSEPLIVSLIKPIKYLLSEGMGVLDTSKGKKDHNTAKARNVPQPCLVLRVQW
jgi:hypothetical protein